MAFQPYELAMSGIEVDLDAKTVRLTLRPMGNDDIDQHVTALVKVDSLPPVTKPPTSETTTNGTTGEDPLIKPK